MTKRYLLLLVTLALVVALSAVSVAGASFKIGVVTGTVSQNEDEYRGAESAIKKYPGMIKHVTYPDNFMNEQETYIAQITGLAADKEVKAIVINQAVPGTVAAIRRVKESRKDMIFVLGEPHEDPPMIEKYADIALIPNNPARGKTIPQLAKQMGAKYFLHYSFPRHMAMQLLAERRDVMKAECEKIGLEFVFVTAPDPMGEGGLPAAQQFILEDVPRQVAKYGKNIAVFSTNCGMQEPLIVATLKAGAIFPEQCCPSPTHGYPGALGLKVTDDMVGNFPAIIKAIDADIIKKGGAGRFATWPAATGYFHTTAGVDLAKMAVEKKIDFKNTAAVKKVLEAAAGYKMVSFERLSNNGNFYQYVFNSIIFGKLGK